MALKIFPRLEIVISRASETTDFPTCGLRSGKLTIKKLKNQTRGLRKTVNALKAELSETRDELSVVLAG